LGISGQTFYRWRRRYDPHNLATREAGSHRPGRFRRPTWSLRQAAAVLALRRQYPRWGKDKLRRLLEKQDLSLSTSMVGRILADLRRQRVLVEPPRPAVLKCQRRKLRLRPWATRKPRFWRVRQPGDLVGLDTKQLHPAPGISLHHFSARDVVSRWEVIEVHPRARWSHYWATPRLSPGTTISCKMAAGASDGRIKDCRRMAPALCNDLRAHFATVLSVLTIPGTPEKI
jgi:hypothetical protein